LDAFSDLSLLTSATSGLASLSSTSSILSDVSQFFALHFPFFLLVFVCDKGWLSLDESTAIYFLHLLTGASASLVPEARCHFEDFLFDYFDCFGGVLFKNDCKHA
jgi:hypothetical protein